MSIPYFHRQERKCSHGYRSGDEIKESQKKSRSYLYLLKFCQRFAEHTEEWKASTGAKSGGFMGADCIIKMH